MAAPEGNDYWKLRSKDGRDKIFETPEELVKSANEYFQWIQDNPLKEQLTYHASGLITQTDGDKMRAMSLEGLCNFIDIHVDTFKLYSERQDFIGVTKRIRQIIDTQQFEGAASGFLNPNIIARKLGLTDRTDHTTGGEKLPTNTTNLAITLPNGKTIDDFKVD